MRTVNLTVLASEGPLARAYLAKMRRAGLQPERILLMVSRDHPATRRPVGRWLPAPARLWYARKVQDHAHNYWPRRIRASRPGLVQAICREMTRICADAAALVDEILGPWDWRRYAPRVEPLLVHGLNDGVLADTLSAIGPSPLLYTGGGIVPPRLLRIPRVRFLHVHPGYLPHVRGADGLLWSVLVRHRPGVSCFWMDGGIDTGDVITAVDFPALRFDLSGQPRPDDQTLYRALFSWCDPLLRATTLVDRLLTCDSNPLDWPVSRQDISTGITYHFMHPVLRRRALARVFVSCGCDS